MGHGANKKFSIVIPTRERADTLIHTLRTVVTQDFSNLEIIVSDNCSTDNTAEVVASFQDNRVSYLRTPYRMSMSDNWEFALEHCRGEYVTFLGDDDGFLPGALTKAANFLQSHPFDALVWEKIDYQWPSHVESALKNTVFMYFPMDATCELQSAQVLNSVINFKEKYTRLPCIYNAFVRRTCIDQVRSLSSNGRFFNGIAPDVYSGIALSVAIERYCHTNYPLTVNGASCHSNGTSFTRSNATVEGSPTAQFMSEINVTYDDRILMGPSPIICVMGEYLQARKYLNSPSKKLPEPPFKKYVQKLFQSSLASERCKDIQDSAKHTAHRLGIKVSSALCPRLDSQRTVDWGYQREVGLLFFKVPATVSNIHQACSMLHGMIPSDIPLLHSGMWGPELIRYAREIRASTMRFLKWAYRKI